MPGRYKRLLSSIQNPVWLWAHPPLYTMGTWSHFHGDKAARVSSWHRTFASFQD